MLVGVGRTEDVASPTKIDEGAADKYGVDAADKYGVELTTGVGFPPFKHVQALEILAGT